MTQTFEVRSESGRARAVRVCVALAIVAMSALSTACASASTPGAPPAATSESTPPLPEQTAAPMTAAPRPPVEELVLSRDGLGSIRFGDDPFTYDSDEAMVWPEYDACGIPGLVHWHANYADRPFDLGYIADDSEPLPGVTGIQIRSESIETDRGLRIGMSEEEALALYPEAYISPDIGHIRRYIADDDPADLFFLVSHSTREGLSDVRRVTSMGAVTWEMGDALNLHGIGMNCL